MDEFAGFDRDGFVREIFRLRREITRLLNRESELQRLLDAERTLVKQIEGHTAVEVSDLKDEVEAQKWRADRHEHRAEAFKDVISMLGGGK